MRDLIDTLLSFVSSPWGALLSVVVPVISGVIGYFLRPKVRKEIGYWVRHDGIFRDVGNLFDGLEVKFQGETITNFTATKIVFTNSGNSTIEQSNFPASEPLGLKLADGFTFYGVNLLHSTNDANRFELQHASNTVSIKFEYIDPRDGCAIQVLHNSDDGKALSISGLIKGGKIRDRRKNTSTVMRIIMVLFLISFVATLGYSFAWLALRHLFKINFAWDDIGAPLILTVFGISVLAGIVAPIDENRANKPLKPFRKYIGNRYADRLRFFSK